MDRVDTVTAGLRRCAAQDLPNFVVIGAMKAGTTSLYQYLKGHDEVFMPAIKELDFFVAEANWCRGIEWYRRQFHAAGAARARGEASPLYTQFPTHDGVPERMSRVLPGVRLVYVVRDPIERMRSHYEHLVITGAEKSPPEVALLDNPVYLECSRYAMQLQRYLDHFPREQILVVTSEALKSERRATVERVYEFIGVDPTHLPEVLGTEFYQTARRRTYPPAVLWARRLAKRHMLRGERAKALVEAMLGGTAACGTSSDGIPDSVGRQVLAPGLRERLADLLRDDVACFRRHMPADFDGWGLT